MNYKKLITHLIVGFIFSLATSSLAEAAKGKNAKFHSCKNVDKSSSSKQQDYCDSLELGDDSAQMEEASAESEENIEEVIIRQPPLDTCGKGYQAAEDLHFLFIPHVGLTIRARNDVSIGVDELSKLLFSHINIYNNEEQLALESKVDSDLLIHRGSYHLIQNLEFYRYDRLVEVELPDFILKIDSNYKQGQEHYFTVSELEFDSQHFLFCYPI